MGKDNAIDHIKLIKSLNRATKNKEQTKYLLLHCYRGVVRNKMFINDIIDDINKLLVWLRNTKNININKLSREIKILDIDSIRSPDELKVKLDEIFEEYLDDNLTLRMEFGSGTVLDWMNISHDHPVRIKLSNYFKTQIDDDELFNDLDNIFNEYFNQTLEHYEKLHDDHTNTRINNKFNKWLTPKFEIIDKYGVNKDMVTAAIKLRDKYKRKEQQYVHRQEYKDDKGKVDEKLTKLQYILGGGIDSQLGIDYENIGKLVPLYVTEQNTWKVRNVWVEVYKYLLENKSKPGKNRIGMYIYLIHLVLNIPVDQLVEYAKSLNMLEKPLNKKKLNDIYNKMFSKGVLTNLKDKFIIMLNPRLDTGIIVSYLQSQNANTSQINLILENIRELNGRDQNLTLRKQYDNIYRSLKKSDYGLTMDELKKLFR